MVPILYLAPIQWNSLWQRPQRIAVGLSRRYRLWYVEPVGLRSLRVADLPRLWRRIVGRHCNTAPVPIVRPRYLPAVAGRVAQQLNRRWLVSQMRSRFPLSGDPWILWIGSPSLLAESLLEATTPACTVYDCMDHYGAFHGRLDAERIRRTEELILRRADCVFATSDNLLAALRQRNPRAELVQNGVDFDRFAVTNRPPRPALLDGINGPILGFHGTLGSWLDYPLLEEIARRRPDWSLVLAGPIGTPDAARLISLPNVNHLGVVDYDKLPSLAAHYDVGLIPFTMNDLTRCVDPIKVLEYLALGLPVVSARLPDLMEMSHVVRFATTADQWIDEIGVCLNEASGAEGAVQARQDIARSRSWDRSIQQIERRLDETLRPALAAHRVASRTTGFRKVA